MSKSTVLGTSVNGKTLILAASGIKEGSKGKVVPFDASVTASLYKSIGKSNARQLRKHLRSKKLAHLAAIKAA